MKKSVEPLTGNLLSEYKTIVVVTQIYCRDHHHNAEKTDNLCEECREFIAFAEFRLSKCPYGQIKPTCRACPIHCYKKDRKEKARKIMAYGGPRMIFRHPLRAIRHLIHERRPIPDRPGKS